MDSPQGLTSGEDPTVRHPALRCPECGAASGPLPFVAADALQGDRLGRCRHCATRFVAEEAPARLLFDCSSCDLPFAAAETGAGATPRCAACADGQFGLETVEDSLVAATEQAVLEALSRSWRFVGTPELLEYLNLLRSEIAAQVEGASAEGQVLIFEDRSQRTLALPSGTWLLSVGTLAALQDEAELAFLLAHDLVHASSGLCGRRWVRSSMRAMLHSTRHEDSSGWTRAALDLIALGHGDSREFTADAQALHAILQLGYDTASVYRYLNRLESGIGRGESGLAELALAHPPVADRRAALRRHESGILDPLPALRVNRELFRRAAGPDVLADGLQQMAPIATRNREAKLPAFRVPLRQFWATVLLVLLIGVLLVLLVLR